MALAGGRCRHACVYGVHALVCVGRVQAGCADTSRHTVTPCLGWSIGFGGGGGYVWGEVCYLVLQALVGRLGEPAAKPTGGVVSVGMPPLHLLTRRRLPHSWGSPPFACYWEWCARCACLLHQWRRTRCDVPPLMLGCGGGRGSGACQALPCPGANLSAPPRRWCNKQGAPEGTPAK